MKLIMLVTLLSMFPQEEKSEIKDPLTPQEELGTFRIDAGLRMELVACDPQIESPVAMSFDERGRLFVVEMIDYPIAEPGKSPQGRIKILEDKDGDGFYETSTAFAEGLLMANGVMPWKGGVLVTCAPHIIFLKDSKGDGKADQREALFEGFTAGNPQLRVSHPNFGLDNWITVANGHSNGKIRRSGRREEPIDIGGMDFSFDLVHDMQSTASGYGQFGLTFDDWGQRFDCSNRNHLMYFPIPNRYFGRNPFLAVPPSKRDDQGPGGAARVYPISANKTNFSAHAGYFTASCGVTVYRGDLLPASYRGTVFTCEPTGNLVHQEVLTPNGATFDYKPPHEGVEFLASRDNWFRPVFLANGPDGALYVVDFYRAEVEHPQFVPADMHYRYNFGGPKTHGRIWRIVPEGYQRKPQNLDLAKAKTTELVALLDTPNGWVQMTAHRLLIERQDPASCAPLRQLALSGSPLGRLQAAWVLEGLRSLDMDLVLALLQDPHPRLRENGALLAEGWVKTSPALQDEILARANDPDSRVRFQAALTLGDLDDDRILPALAKVAEKGASDRWTRLAIQSAVPGRAGKLAGLVSDPGLLRELSTLVGSRRDPDEVAEVLKNSQGRDSRTQLALLNGLAEGMGRRGSQLGAFLEAFPEAKRPIAAQGLRLLEDTASLASDASRDIAERLDAVHCLAHVSWESARPALSKLVAEDPLQEIRIAAVGALSAHHQPEVGEILMKGWKRYMPALKREVLEAMSRQPERLQFLLGEIEAGRLAGGELGPSLIPSMVNHRNTDVRDRARKVLEAHLPEERKQVIERYKDALSKEGDPRKGKEIFQKNCTSCHRLAGIGAAVGPDISDTMTKTAEALLIDILDPSRVIDSNYVNYLVRTKSGSVLTGFISSQTASSITLRRGEGQQDVILQQDIEEIKSSGTSLMPDGLEKNIPVSSMSDLIAFIKRWRDLPPEAIERK